jgi:mono/diheme cytochrome c family protein
LEQLDGNGFKSRSVKTHSANVVVPELTDPGMVARGLQLFRENCAQCHGALGIPPADFAKGLMPLAPPLIQIAREWTPAQIYWATRYGIKMSAVPAWVPASRCRYLGDRRLCGHAAGDRAPWTTAEWSGRP